MMRFGSRCPSVLTSLELGTSKIIEILSTVCKNQGFAILSSSRLSSLSWHPFGLLLGSLLALRMAETSLKIPLGPAKSSSRVFFFGPGGVQERPKRLTGGQNKGTKRATRAKRPPRGLWDPFWSHFVTVFAPFWSYFGAIVGAVLDSFCCRFLRLKAREKTRAPASARTDPSSKRRARARSARASAHARLPSLARLRHYVWSCFSCLGCVCCSSYSA